MTTDRDRLRATFDSAARLYQQARPDYPEELYDELVWLADLRAGDRLLESGRDSSDPVVAALRDELR